MSERTADVDEPESTDDDLEAEELDDEPSIEEVAASDLDPDEISIEDLENQDWTLGGNERELIGFAGMKFLVEGADDDVILNLIASSALAAEDQDAVESDGNERMYDYVSDAVVAPEITPERWREMKTGQRVGLTMRIAEFDGIHHLMDFPAGGPSPQPGE